MSYPVVTDFFWLTAELIIGLCDCDDVVVTVVDLYGVLTALLGCLWLSLVVPPGWAGCSPINNSKPAAVTAVAQAKKTVRSFTVDTAVAVLPTRRPTRRGHAPANSPHTGTAPYNLPQEPEHHIPLGCSIPRQI